VAEVTVNPAIAPYVPTYATYTPYISPEEFLTANTGVDTSQLVPSGSLLTEEQALLDLLARASSQADRICRKPLAATVDIVSDEYRIFRDRTLRIPMPYKPIVAITAVSTGYAINALTPMTDLSGIFIKSKVARIPVASATLPSVAFSQHPPALAAVGRLFAQVTYVNGWMHSTLASPVIAGAASISPFNVDGAVPGLPFTIKDGASTENAVIAPSYVYGSASVPLVAPLQYAHGAGTTVSALPPFVKDAVIDLAKSLAKAKGSKAVVMGAINGQKITAPKTQTTEPGGDADLARATATLLTLRRSR
jgi:hypothetical protein